MALYYSGYSESRNIHWPNSFEGRQPRPRRRIQENNSDGSTAIPHSMRSMRSAEFSDAATARNMRKAAQAAP